jgi:FkbM family methyltransferase
MIRRLKPFLPAFLIRLLIDLRVAVLSYSERSYSQEGEDMILRRIFQDRDRGFYVDVGAHHPKHLSNTYYFYQKGWTGINIDAMPGSMRLFRKYRPRDINVEAAVANEDAERTFFIFNGPAVNSFDEQLSRSRESESLRITQTAQLRTRTLASILQEHLPAGTVIQFLSVDVEGLDLQVLQSNNWQFFRPEWIAVECWDLRLSDIQVDPVVSFLDQMGYDLFGKGFSTAFFKDRTCRGLDDEKSHTDTHP